MPLQNILYRVCGGKQVVIDAGQPQLVLVFQKSASHMFFEKTAEIAGFQKRSPGYFSNGNRLVIVLRRISEHAVETG